MYLLASSSVLGSVLDAGGVTAGAPSLLGGWGEADSEHKVMTGRGRATKASRAEAPPLVSGGDASFDDT